MCWFLLVLGTAITVIGLILVWRVMALAGPR
jgi:hypothetical protein